MYELLQGWKNFRAKCMSQIRHTTGDLYQHQLPTHMSTLVAELFCKPDEESEHPGIYSLDCVTGKWDMAQFCIE